MSIERQPLAARVIVTLFLAPFLLLCGLTALAPVVSGARAAWTYAWTRTTCTIDASEVREARGQFEMAVWYRYRTGGAMRWGDRYRFGYEPATSRGTAEILAEAYTKGSQVACYVNPLSGGAVLERGDLQLARGGTWMGSLAGFVFLAALLFALVLVHAPERAKWIWDNPRMLTTAVPRVLAGACLLGGVVLGWFMIVQPVVLMLRARTWATTPCRIERSQLVIGTHTVHETGRRGRSRTREQTSYGYDLLYRYQVGGREYGSQRYRFFEGSAGKERNEAIVARFPVGAMTTCFVDLARPEEAVLDRSVGGEAAWGLVPLFLLAVGAGLLRIR